MGAAVSVVVVIVSLAGDGAETEERKSGKVRYSNAILAGKLYGATPENGKPPRRAAFEKWRPRQADPVGIGTTAAYETRWSFPQSPVGSPPPRSAVTGTAPRSAAFVQARAGQTCRPTPTDVRESFVQRSRQTDFAHGKPERGKHLHQDRHVVVAKTRRPISGERNRDAFQRRSRREPYKMQDIIGAAFRAQFEQRRNSLCGIRIIMKTPPGERPALRQQDVERTAFRDRRRPRPSHGPQRQDREIRERLARADHERSRTLVGRMPRPSCAAQLGQSGLRKLAANVVLIYPHQPSAISSQPIALTVTRSLALTTTVVVSASTIAGPSKAWPGW